MFHVIYRWVIACYFIGWLITSGIQFSNSGARYLIYLTNWAIIGFVFYLLVAAFSVTAKFVTVHCYNKVPDEIDRTTDYQFEKPKGSCGFRSNKLSWYQMIHWASFSILSEIALVIAILYWILLYNGGPVDGVNANTHLLNAIVSILDVFFFGMPVNLLHIIYPACYGVVYASFSGIYWAANGTNPENEERYIYSLLDYNTSTAAVIAILVVILYIPLIHLLYYVVYLARFWLVYAVYGHNKMQCWGMQVLEEHDIDEHTEKENDVAV